nr:cyclic nucleotide-binding domain-containing protein [Micromonospora sp. DSM 115978]
MRTQTETRVFEPGDVVFDTGDPADSVYFVTRGLVNVEVTVGGGDRVFRLNSVPAGSAFGELALIDGGARSSRIVVAEPTECEVLTLAGFHALRDAHPRACDAVYRAVAR